ncbi:MAG: glutathione peroxidase [Deltaproteobacteria bacterium]|nr:glutathione peroxidase [Deltaproteobacteria bacterium]
MRKPFTFILLFAVLATPVSAQECPPLLAYKMKPLRGGPPVNFCEAYRGKVVLIVNTASQCGYTPQFKGLEAVYQKYRERGLVVLGFPSNDFKQEFLEAERTAKVCYLNYGVSFPMFSTSAVTGSEANPLFKQLAAQSGQEPRWNFHKYLVDRAGKVVAAYPAQTTPEDAGLGKQIEALLEGVSQP